jgi:hypothetical protein
MLTNMNLVPLDQCIPILNPVSDLGHDLSKSHSGQGVPMGSLVRDAGEELTDDRRTNARGVMLNVNAAGSILERCHKVISGST